MNGDVHAAHTSHFWPLQLTETGLFAGLAAILVLFAVWWTHQRST